MNKLLLISACQKGKINRVLEDTFQQMYSSVTGRQCREGEADDKTSDLILLGNIANNKTIAELYLAHKFEINNFRVGSDDYMIKSFSLEENGLKRNVLILYGGRIRSTIYAIYRFFEINCGCRYFWDGDRIPKQEEIHLTAIDVNESPRFYYRGMRYFAHRSLHRFQAEHWSFEDWKREIDWCLKKRLNLFMLRIGMDDLFQKAFPDVVPYEGEGAQLVGEGYNDRRLFWDLKFRGELRKQILEYAFERDLMHLEDCGTMTHWNSRTPPQFLKTVNPTLLWKPKDDVDATNVVWDVMDDKNLENYFKLTDTHIKEYGKAGLFHTIGLAERSVSLETRKYVYNRIINYIQENYENAKLFLYSWEFCNTVQKGGDVLELLNGFDKDTCICFDCTSDRECSNDFTHWSIVNNYPWIFGIFHAYEEQSDIRGNYTIIERQMKIAKEDQMCKGMVMWPELSHGDTFMLEYFAKNTFSKQVIDVQRHIKEFCNDRYGENAGIMEEVWRMVMPIISLNHWSMIDRHSFTHDYLFNLLVLDTRVPEAWDENIQKAVDLIPSAKKALQILSAYSNTQDEMLRRDIFDIERSIFIRYIQYSICYIEKCFNEGIRECLLEKVDMLYRLVELYTEILGGHEDFSLYQSLQKMHSVHTVQPDFERTLKNNAANFYCRSHIYELSKYIYLPEVLEYKKQLQDLIEKNAEKVVLKEKPEYQETFIQTPMKAEYVNTNFEKIAKEFPVLVKKMFV